MCRITFRMMKFLATVCVCFCFARSGLAWWDGGHMVIAQIAYNHLDSEVRAKCDALIAVPLTFADTRSTNFVTAAVWADDFKSSLGTGTSHYTDIPISLDLYPTNHVVDNPLNVVTAIRQHIATLQDSTATLSNQATALRYLLHYV